MVRPHRRPHALRGNHEPVPDEPKPGGLREDDDCQDKDQVDAHRDGKGLPQFFGVTPSKPEREVPLARRRHRPGKEAEHHHHARNDVVDAVVLRAERRQHRAHRIQRHEHDQDLPEVEEEHVPCYARCAGLAGDGRIRVAF